MQMCSYFIEKMIPLLFKDVFLRIIICADRLYFQLPTGSDILRRFWSVLIHFSLRSTQNAWQDPAGLPAGSFFSCFFPMW